MHIGTIARTGAPVILVLVAAACSSLQIDRAITPSPDDWEMLGGSPARRNETAVDVPIPLVTGWIYDPNAGVSAQMLQRDSVLFVATLKGELHAVSVPDGKKIGVVSLGAPVVGTPTLSDDRIVVPLSRETESVLLLDLRTGHREWSADVGPVETAPLVRGNRVYVTTLLGTAVCLDIADGAELWKFRTRPGKDRRSIRSSPAADSVRMYFGCDDGWLYAVDLRSGQLAWKQNVGSAVFGPPLLCGSTVVVGGLSGTVSAVRADSGIIRWRMDLGARLYNAPATDGLRIVVGAADGRLVAIDPARGSVEWTFASSDGVSCTPLIADSTVIFGTLDKTLHVLSLRSGRELWSWKGEGRMRVSPLAGRGRLYVCGDDRTVTLLTGSALQ